MRLNGWGMVSVFVIMPIALLWAGVLLQWLGHRGECGRLQDAAYSDGYAYGWQDAGPALLEPPTLAEPSQGEVTGWLAVVKREDEAWQRYRQREGVPDGMSPAEWEARQAFPGLTAVDDVLAWSSRQQADLLLWARGGPDTAVDVPPVTR